MSAPRFGRLQKATAIVPLALLSAAWTASLAGVGVGISAASANDHGSGLLPDGTSVPAEAIQAPASVSAKGDYGLGITGNKHDAISGASASGIPAAALAAYQRAETVINAADKSCHLPWQLIAAIGRVESDHGRANGNTLTDKGFATPGIYGIALNGRNHTQAIADTDAGQYDDDARWDRAVGPMQFIPSTWSVVGVDGDNDGKRDPQDINDAALATAVYLCSGKDDLSTDSGQRASVYRYNHSQSYVDLVLAIMHAYMNGNFTAVPNGTTSYSGGVIVPDPQASTHAGGKKHDGTKHGDGQQHSGGTTAGSGTNAPTTPTTPSPSPSTPGSSSVPGLPVPTLPSLPVPTPTVPTTLPTTQVEHLLTAAEALTVCQAEFAKIPDPLGLLTPLTNTCAGQVKGMTKDDALALIPNTLDGILDWLT